MKNSLIVLASLLAGCATSQSWTKPGATSADLAQDALRCSYEAEAATAAVENPVGAGVKEAMLKQSCMMAKGWRR